MCTSAKLACVCWVACRSVFELVHATKLCFTIANKPTNCSASVCVCVCVAVMRETHCCEKIVSVSLRDEF